MSRRHPHPTTVAAYLRRIADMLEEHGPTATERAAVLAARGWPTSVTGDGRRSSNTSTSVERAVLNPDPFAGIDEQLAQHIRTIWKTATDIESDIVRILTHATTDDPTPPGTGSCQRCGKFCRPTAQRPDNRIRSGWCPSCRRAWYRANKPDRFTFNRQPQMTT